MDILFRALIAEFDPQKQATLMNMYKSALLAEKENRKREFATMKKEVMNEVLSQISVNADTKDAVLQIDALNNALRNLGKG